MNITILKVALQITCHQVKIYQKIQNYMFSDLAMGNTGGFAINQIHVMQQCIFLVLILIIACMIMEVDIIKRVPIVYQIT